jgi:energy-converting hydrogenase A subunit E
MYTDIIFYVGCFLIIFGAFAVVFGPEVGRSAIVRYINLEISSFGVMLLFLYYFETLALLTYVAATTLITLVFMRLFVKNAEMRRVEK